MRRTACILASVAASSAVALAMVGAPADAHFCATPAEIPVGKEVVLNVGVAAEDKAVRMVEVTVPDGFVLKEAIGYLGYTGTVDGRVARFDGAEMAPYSCGYFSLAGHAARRGRLVATITTHAADGTLTRYPDPRPISRFPAQVIYAGITRAQYEDTHAGDSRSTKRSPATAVAVGVGAGGVAVTLAYLWNRRRTSG